MRNNKRLVKISYEAPYNALSVNRITEARAHRRAMLINNPLTLIGKTCSKCKQYKEAICFHKCNKMLDGHKSSCIECERDKTKE
jgi:hypothetical protein